jgi:hypothetical protein
MTALLLPMIAVPLPAIIAVRPPFTTGVRRRVTIGVARPLGGPTADRAAVSASDAEHAYSLSRR